MPSPNHNHDGEQESCTVCAAVHQREMIEQIRRDLIKLSEPFAKMKCDILAVALPEFIYERGRGGVVNYRPEVTSALDEVDRLWQETRDRFLDSTVLGKGRNPWPNSYLNS